jgi:hypothetical protein
VPVRAEGENFRIWPDLGRRPIGHQRTCRTKQDTGRCQSSAPRLFAEFRPPQIPAVLVAAISVQTTIIEALVSGSLRASYRPTTIGHFSRMTFKTGA